MPSPNRRQMLASLAGLIPCMLARRSSAERVVWRFQASYGLLHVLADYRPDPPSQLEQLVDLRVDLKRALELRVAEQSVYLQLFQDRVAMRRQLSQVLPAAPDRRALFVRAGRRTTIYACRGPALDVDLRHELTHALLHQAMPGLPLWLDEGLAEYFEQPRGRRSQRTDYLQETKDRLADQPVITPALLQELDQLEQMSADHYRYAWGWVHFMLHGPAGGREELVRYLADLRAGIPAGRLGRRLTQRLGRLDNHFRDHFQDWK